MTKKLTCSNSLAGYTPVTNHCTWKQLLEAALARHEDKLVEVYSRDPEQYVYHKAAEDEDEDELEELLPFTYSFSADLGAPGLNDPFFYSELGPAFTAWGEKRVYFPATYDGRQWVDSVPRNPCAQATPHIGG